MANVTYTSRAVVDTVAKRKIAYDVFANLLVHLDHFNLNLISLVWNQGTDRTITVVLSGPLPDQLQIDHFDLI